MDKKLREKIASITFNEPIVTDNGNETSFDFGGRIFVSIEPFVENHPCAFHSLTGCQGELAEKEFDVYLQDEEGNVGSVSPCIFTTTNFHINLQLMPPLVNKPPFIHRDFHLDVFFVSNKYKLLVQDKK